ncbi:hypothetical protein [Pseudoxanthomonas indica]|uniref:Hemin transport protein n=1 Tax=Pseudoxanthomonas indica TaxID=428993 RepID=A0A1T5JQ44_9GAMM|nr:hypothetical protein [Pseudoxanthomonas indica]GGD43654.1 hypothetical protein GCM10007235_14540 [Pseudoxanthomonas indica]SKC53532.1 hypothetical protein SAMN06296058_0993 [Pseudoxanthomonas indica]
MSLRALPTSWELTDIQSAGALPMPRQLAELGAVLCLYRADHGSELGGWARATRVAVHAGLDSDGLREALHFFDGQGRCCWQVYLLPDSDFLAWDRLLAGLPKEQGGEVCAGVGERLWRRLAGRLRGEQWRAAVLHLHAVRRDDGRDVLAASLASLSHLGASTAREIARAESAEGEALADECCCAKAASREPVIFSGAAYADAVIPWNQRPE